MAETALSTVTACPLDCPDACSLEVQVEGGHIAKIDGTRTNPYTAGFICSKVRHFADHMDCDERLLEPARRVGPKGKAEFETIGWDEALDLVAAELKSARDRFGGESILPLSYGGSNGWLTQDTTDARLWRRLGASHLLRNVCAVPTGVASQGLYGKMVGTDLADYVHCDLIVIWGTNPSATGIHFVPVVQAALKRGAKLVVVDPIRTPLAKKADLHLAPHPGTDLPLALAVVSWLFENGRADLEFLEQHTTGSDELRRRAGVWTLERAAEVTGIDAAAIEAFARLYADASPAGLRCGWGLERNRNGTSAVAAVLSLPAVAGKFGVRGGGYTMSNSRAWTPDIEPAVNQPVADDAVRRVNMNVVGRVLTTPQDPPVQCLFVYNCNPLATLPEQQRVRAGLEREDLFTVVFEQVLTDTARYADVLLPATTFLEHRELGASYGATPLTDGPAVIAPRGSARNNYEVFEELCRRCGLERADDPNGAEELVEALQKGLLDPTQARTLRRDGLLSSFRGEAPIPFVDHFPPTPDGKVHLFPEELEEASSVGIYGYLEDPATAEYPLALISPATSRTISSTFGQLVRRQVPVQIHPDDASKRGIATGDRVRVFNALGEVICEASIDVNLVRGTLCLPKGLWSHNTLNGASSNSLVPDDLTDLGDGACFNDARVEIEPAS